MTTASPDVGVLHLLPDRWSTMWRATHWIAASLARHFPSVWVEPRIHWRDALRSINQPADTPDSEMIPANLELYPPEPWLPRFHGVGVLDGWTFRARLRRARHMLQRRGCRTVVLFLWRPQFVRALDTDRYDLACYYIKDEYSYAMESAPEDPEELELIRRADLVFVHSRKLMETKGGINPNTFHSPNGVDYEFFATPRSEPADLEDVPRPRVGYVGALKKQLDWSLIQAVVNAHAHLSFVFVGPVSPHSEAAAAVERLGGCDNVYFLGARSAREIPAYVQHFDVGSLPYVKVPYTDYIYPLKLHEYLATGIPVIGTPISSLRSFRDVIELAEDLETWSAGLDRCLSPEANTESAVKRRRRVAREHDWDAIVDRLAGHITRALTPEVAGGGGS